MMNQSIKSIEKLHRFGFIFWNFSRIYFSGINKFSLLLIYIFIFTISIGKSQETESSKVQSDKLSYFTIQAFTLIESKEFVGALNSCNQALKINPLDTVILNYKGVIYFELKDFEKAENEFDKSINNSIAYEDAYFNRALLFSEINSCTNAIADYQSVLNINNRNDDARTNRAMLYIENEEYDRAIQDLSILINNGVVNKTVLGNRAYSYYMLKQYDLSSKDCELGLQLDPKSSFLLKYAVLSELNIRNSSSLCKYYLMAKDNKVKFDESTLKIIINNCK